MDGNYNFWQDAFDTYQSLSDWMKLAWLVTPPAFLLGLVALIMRLRIDLKQADHGFTGKLIYSIHHDDENQFHIMRHGPKFDEEATLIFLNPPSQDLHLAQNPNQSPLSPATLAFKER